MNSYSLEATAEIGRKIAGLLRPRLSEGVLVTLSGPLGAGKTALVRAIAVALGVPAGCVSSPSFVLVNEYRGEGVTIYHADAYRLTGPEELENVGWEEMLAERNRLILLEWPEKVPGLDGLDAPGTLHVSMELIGEQSRRIKIRQG